MLIPKPRPERFDPPIQLDKLLLAEGDTPAHFFDKLTKELRLEDQIEIRNYGGIKQLRSYLKVIASTTEFKSKIKSLGIVRDAEDDAAAANASVHDAIRHAGLAPEVATHVYILPDFDSPGMIETLCLRSVMDDPIFECIDRFFECLNVMQRGLPTGYMSDKSKLDFFLAAINKPQMFPGIAAHYGAFPLNHIAFDGLRTFLQTL